MKKLILILMLVFSSNIILSPNYTMKAEAGIIKWGVKKLIGGMIKIIFSVAKDSVIEYNKAKLKDYLKKHPEHIDYTINLIKEQIKKSPQFKDRGTALLDDLKQYTKNKIGV